MQSISDEAARQRLEGSRANSVYRMAELDEVIGALHGIEKTEVGLIALIGKVSVLLPEELANRLSGYVGKQIGILRCDGYRVRRLKTDGENGNSY